jgi:hypothetical protein
LRGLPGARLVVSFSWDRAAFNTLKVIADLGETAQENPSSPGGPGEGI